jgi:hypothetical protein
MLKVDLLQAATVMFSGILAGFEIAVHYGIGSPPQSLSEEAQVRLRQAMVLRLRVLAPGIFLPTLACGISLALRARQLSTVWPYSVAVGSLILWTLIRIWRTVPVNSATLEWDPYKPPTNWRQQVERTERFHVLAAWAAVIAFLCFLLPAMHV